MDTQQTSPCLWGGSDLGLRPTPGSRRRVSGDPAVQTGLGNRRYQGVCAGGGLACLTKALPSRLELRCGLSQVSPRPKTVSRAQDPELAVQRDGSCRRPGAEGGIGSSLPASTQEPAFESGCPKHTPSDTPTTHKHTCHSQGRKHSIPWQTTHTPLSTLKQVGSSSF